MPANLLYVKNFNKIAITDYTGKMSLFTNLFADKQWFIVFLVFVVSIHYSADILSWDLFTVYSL